MRSRPRRARASSELSSPTVTLRPSATRNVVLATVAFALCFTAWSLIAPFAKTFKKDLGLSYTEALFLTAVPVVLGSLARIPLGYLTDRRGGRLVFTCLLAFSAVPAALFGYAHGYAALIAVGFLLGVAGASFAVGGRVTPAWTGTRTTTYATAFARDAGLARYARLARTMALRIRTPAATHGATSEATRKGDPEFHGVATNQPTRGSVPIATVEACHFDRDAATKNAAAPSSTNDPSPIETPRS